jgi:gas vesicle protein
MLKILITLSGFTAGAIFGAVVALLFAPSSGEDLREQIREQADIQWQRMSASVEKIPLSIQPELDQIAAASDAAGDRAASGEG